jgi:4-amino-4-deoxy-L-arabinose transferase-like glycosyltransferase
MSAISRHKSLLVILLCALVLRLIAAGTLQWYLDERLHRNFLIEGDAKGYWALAEQIAAGGPYEINQPPRQVLRMPGFPAVVAAAMVLADRSGNPEKRFLVARCLLAVVGTGACFAVFLLGRELFDARVGTLATAIAAVSPVMIGFSVEILSETLFALTLVVSVWMMAKLRSAHANDGRGPSFGLAAAVGVAVALACYVRPSWLLAAPLFALLHFMFSRQRKRACVEGCLVLVGLALAMAPWTIRNYRATGHWVVTTLWLGPSLYDGFNDRATGDSDLSFYDRELLQAGGMSEYDVNRHYTQKAVRYALDHPRRVVELAFAKLWRFWKPWPNAAQFDNWAAKLAVGLFFVPVLAFAIVGFWKNRHNTWAWLLTAGPVLYFSALHSVFVGSLRYRLPAEYPLCALSAAGALACFAEWYRAPATKHVESNA